MIGAIRDALFPEDQRCVCCGRPLLGQEAVLCLSCAKALDRLKYRFDEEVGGKLPACLSMAWAAFPYREQARKLERALKFGGALLAAEPLCHRMAYMAACYAPDAITHVPLHSARLTERGYDQACELAWRICAITGITRLSGALTRVRNTPTQVGKDRKQRRENVKDAFEGNAELVSGKRILLIDDVFTTGATASACAMALKRSGAREIGFVAACRA